ncbi:putative hemagglutinin/hemolysin-related protein [Streptococcus sp. DD11]|nr:putative hemagglutinin/hemolysin-related protein [Streptococcus sp. DD11]
MRRRSKRDIGSAVNAQLKADSKTTDIHAVDSVRETLTFSISGHEADYSGGHIKIHFQNGKAIKVNPSPVGGVTYSQEAVGNDLNLKIEPANLKGGASYSFVYTFQMHALTTNWGGAVQAIGPDHKVTAIAALYDKNGQEVKELGRLEHIWKVLENGVVGGTAMSSGQVIGYDLDNDGKIDDGASALSFYLYNGVKDPKTNNAKNDYFNYGNGVFDGRMINGLGINEVGGNIIDPIVSYTYDVALKEGYELTDEAKSFGWTADAAGYHLTITREKNPLKDINNNQNKYLPISFRLKDSKVTDIHGKRQTLEITATYTKEDASQYQNQTAIPYDLRVLKTEPSPKSFYEFKHYAQTDSEIIRSHGEAEYRSYVNLTAEAEVEKDYSLDDFTMTHTIKDERESYRTVNAIENHQWDAIFSHPNASVEVYNKASGQLLGTFNDKTRSLSLTEEQNVKELEYRFRNISMKKTAAANTSIFGFQTKTRYNDWSSLYKNQSITKLESKTESAFSNKILSLYRRAQRLN